jgi:hypothetical protein
MYIYAISLILVILAVGAFYYTDNSFWCATGLAAAKLLVYVLFEDYAWWGSLFTALIIYVLGYLYFWGLHETANKPRAYWTILVIGGCILVL